MRRIIIASVAGVLLAGAGFWYAHARLFRDPVATAQALLARGQIQAASLELRNAVRRDPGNVAAHARLGALQLMLGDPVAAERELNAAGAGGYHGTDLRPLLARAALAQGRGKEVLTDYAPDGLPPADAASLLVTRGQAQLAAGDPEAARASAEAASRLTPTLPDAAMLGARVAMAQDQPGWALEQLDRVLRTSPALPEALLMKAAILRSTGEPAAAGKVLDAAVAAAPGAANARLARASLELAGNDAAAARADIDALLKHDPHSPYGNLLRAQLQIRAKDWAAAELTLQAIQPLLPRLPRGEYDLALVKSNRGQLEQASEAIGHYTARAPGDPDGWRLRARIDLLGGRQADAAADLAHLGAGRGAPAAVVAATDDSDAASTPQALTRLASLQLGTGDAGGAEHELERSLEAVPSPADAAAASVVAALRVGDIDRAAAGVETLARTPKADPERVAALTGAVRIAQLDLPGARAAFEAGLQAAPDSPTLTVDLARVLALQGHAAEAEAKLAPILARAPANPTALATQLDILNAAGDTRRALAALQAARAAQPENAGLLIAQVALTARSGGGASGGGASGGGASGGGASGGGTAAALALLDAAPHALAEAPRLRALRAQLLLAEHKPAEAAEIYRQMLQAAPDDVDLRRRLIELLLAGDKAQEALDLAHEGLRGSPGNSVLMQAYVGITYRISGIDPALALAATLRADPADMPVARLLKGAIYMTAGRPADAAAADAAEREGAASGAPFGALVIAEATALRAAGKPDAARKVLLDWTATDPDPTASDVLASFDIEGKRLDEAATALRAVLAARPGDAMALNNLAWVYIQKGDKQALGLARKAYLLSPGGQTADTLGWILTRQGDAATGLLLLRQASARLPRDPSVHYHLAVALKDTGQTAAAAALVNAVLARKPTFDEQEQARQLQQELAAAPAPTAPAPTAMPAAAPAR